jgi:hypothetical protein
LNRGAVGTRRTVFVVGVAVALTVEAVTASVFVMARRPKDFAFFPSGVNIAVVGDAYSAGTNNRVVWPTLLAQRTGWSVANFALPDAGFASDGPGGHAFTYQVDRAQQSHPRTVLIVGGIADEGLAVTDFIGAGATDAINKIKLGGQQALVIGPTWYETPVPELVAQLSSQIHDAADQARVPYLDALDPPWLTRDQMQPNLSGPTDDGQSVIADKVAAWLRTEVDR